MKRKTNLIMILAAMVAAITTASVNAAGLDPNTFGDATKWEMNSIFYGGTYYGEAREMIESSFTNSSPWLILGSNVTGGGVNAPVLSADGGGRTGLPGDKSLIFDGTTSVAHSLDGHQVWNDNWEDFQIEFYFKPDRITTTSGDIQVLLFAPTTWIIQMAPVSGTTAQLQFQGWKAEGGSITARSHNFNNSVIGQWNHVYATAIDGVMTISLNGEPCAVTVEYQQLQESVGGRVFAGRHSSNIRHYDGALDDITIAEWVWHDFLEPYEDAPGTQLLLHFDEVNNYITPDDNSANPTRANDGILQGNVSLAASALNSQFGNSLYFNGGSVEAGRQGIDLANVRVEFWAKLDKVNQDTGNRVAFRLPGSLRVIFLMMTGNTWRIMFDAYTPESSRVDVQYLSQDFVSQWNHYAFEFENGAQRILINGELQDEVNANDTVLGYPSGNMWIGMHQNWPFYGNIDEFRVSKVSLECGDLGFLPGDLNKDCIVDIEDIKLFVSNWLQEN